MSCDVRVQLCSPVIPSGLPHGSSSSVQNMAASSRWAYGQASITQWAHFPRFRFLYGAEPDAGDPRVRGVPFRFPRAMPYQRACSRNGNNTGSPTCPTRKQTRHQVSSETKLAAMTAAQAQSSLSGFEQTRSQESRPVWRRPPAHTVPSACVHATNYLIQNRIGTLSHTRQPHPLVLLRVVTNLTSLTLGG